MGVVSTLARLTLVLCVLVAAAMILSGLGTRWGLWDWMTGLTILRLSTIVAIGLLLWGIVLLVVAAVQRTRREIVILAHAVVLILIPLVYVGWHYQVARTVPPIHDVTTDPTNPPQIRPLAGVPERSLTYDRDAVYTQQAMAYPDIQPLATDQPSAPVFERALEVAHELGWEVVEIDRPNRRFQAVDTTLWFGFKDDVVVRVTPLPVGSVVDIRSASRVGRSDIGMNAARIRAFFNLMDPGREPGQLGWGEGRLEGEPERRDELDELQDEFVPPEDPALQR
jgi:uncharacterized protein (DUF1499 family)